MAFHVLNWVTFILLMDTISGFLYSNQMKNDRDLTENIILNDILKSECHAEH